jgi:hypothetical protein
MGHDAARVGVDEHVRHHSGDVRVNAVLYEYPRGEVFEGFDFNWQ